MNIKFLTIAFIACAVSGQLFARDGASFPAALLGLWAESPITCDLLRKSPANVPSDRAWVRIAPEGISGTSTGRFIKALGPRSAQAIDATLNTITVDYEVSQKGILFETVTGARASMQYMRCK